MTPSDRNDELCGILQDYTSTDAVLMKARRAIDAGVWSEAWTKIQHAGRYCEQRQVAEIELLFDRNGNVNEAHRCINCGFWGMEDGWCATEECQKLEADEIAERNRNMGIGDWTSDDLRAGEPSRA